jgi:hypothetical protein
VTVGCKVTLTMSLDMPFGGKEESVGETRVSKRTAAVLQGED